MNSPVLHHASGIAACPGLAPPLPESTGTLASLTWKRIRHDGLPGGDRLWQAPVPGGWLILFKSAADAAPALTFVPTPHLST